MVTDYFFVYSFFFSSVRKKIEKNFWDMEIIGKRRKIFFTDDLFPMWPISIVVEAEEFGEVYFLKKFPAVVERLEATFWVFPEAEDGVFVEWNM